MPRTLYDLAAADPNVRFSPYCWRIKLALKHKGLDWDGIPWRFTDKDVLAFSASTTVPVLVDDDRVIADSWQIARYLDERYPHASLFGGETGRAHALFIRLWCESTLHAQIVRLILMDLFARLHPKDQSYFRSSREARFGKPLEETAVEPAIGLPVFRSSLAPVRAVIKLQPYLGGSQPSFADHIVLGALLWARAMSPLELLESTDPVHAWRQRMLEAYDGYAAGACVRPPAA